MRAVLGGTGLALAAAAIAAGSALAAPHPAAMVGAANAGLVSGDFGAGPTNTGPLARCQMTGTSHAHLDPRVVPSAATFGAADADCSLHGSTAITAASGDSASLDSIRDASGLGLELTDFAARCTATADTAAPEVTIGAVRAGSLVSLPGGRLPSPIPANYAVSGPAGARIVFNEQVPDGQGGVTVSVVHLVQHGGIRHGGGDIYFGRADCAPLG